MEESQQSRVAIVPLPESGPLRLIQLNGFAVPEHFLASSENVTLEVQVNDRGEARCIALTARDDDGVNGETLRRIPVARLLRAAYTAAAARYEPLEEGGEPVFRFVTTPLEERAAFYERFSKEARQPRRGSPITDDNLREVADLYRAALKRKDPPTQTVAEQMHVARSTAARWVATARERGILGPALKGRAGEAKR